MKSRRCVIFLLILLGALVFSYTHPIEIQNSMNSHERLGSKVHSEVDLEYYTEHIPIIIDSNQDFEDLSIIGTGAQDDPYLIERFYVVATGAQNQAISISNTDVCFIVRNCFVVTEFAGIEVWDVGDATASIINNTCASSTGFGAGIVFWGVRYGTISENRCSNLSQGIHLNDASRNYITNNSITDNSYQGINIRHSNRNTITGNLIENTSQHGVALVGTSRYNMIHNNQLVDNGREETYRIDGEERGQLTSQGFDEGTNNTWYDLETEIGNYWSDYSGTDTYSIDGLSNSVDLYPMMVVDDSPTDTNLDLPIVEISGILIIITATVIVAFIAYRYRFQSRN